MVTNIGRNEPCPCGSGKKHKKCCGEPQSSTLRLSGSQLVVCLLRQLGGSAVIELEEVAALGDTAFDMEQEGNSMHLSVVESEEQGVILTPDTNIIL